MAKTFRVSFDIPETKLSTIVGLLSAEVGNLVIRDTATIGNNNSPPPKQARTYKKRGTQTVHTLVHTALAKFTAGKELSYDFIKDLLVKNNYNPSSHTSIISNLVSNGMIERTKPQTFKIVKAFTVPAN